MNKVYNPNFVEEIASKVDVTRVLPSHYAVFEISKIYKGLDDFDFFIIDRLLQNVENDSYLEKKSEYILSDYDLLNSMFTVPGRSNQLLVMNRINKLSTLTFYFKEYRGGNIKLISEAEYLELKFFGTMEMLSGVERLNTHKLILNVVDDIHSTNWPCTKLDVEGVYKLLKLCEGINK